MSRTPSEHYEHQIKPHLLRNLAKDPPVILHCERDTAELSSHPSSLMVKSLPGSKAKSAPVLRGRTPCNPRIVQRSTCLCDLSWIAVLRKGGALGGRKTSGAFSDTARPGRLVLQLRLCCHRWSSSRRWHFSFRSATFAPSPPGVGRVCRARAEFPVANFAERH